MLVTSAGKVIRTRVNGIRITLRVAQGVCLVRLGEQERVVSVERLADADDYGGVRASSLPSEPPGPPEDVADDTEADEE
jgi:DNA gyrase subunit A